MKTLPDLLPGRISWRRCAVAITVAGTLLAPIPAAAQTDTFGCVTPPEDTLHLEVSNPSPGDKVPVGDMVIHGVSYDRSANTGTGVDRVSLFQGTRGAGGALLAEATLGMPNPFAAPGSQWAQAGWAATIAIPNTPGPMTLSVYSHSAVSDHESTVAVPMMVAQNSAPGAQCTITTTAAQGMPSPAESIHLELSNPQPNATVLVGSTNVQGLAFDTAATAGTGIDRVTLFLGNRDEGGAHLADATLVDSTDAKHGLFTATFDVPSETGGHDLFVYAHSSISGHDAVMSVPIVVAR
jgi:hypothetical protein